MQNTTKLNILMFCFNDRWYDWEEWGFAHRSGLIAHKLSVHPHVNKLIIINTPTSVFQAVRKSVSRDKQNLNSIRFSEISDKLTVVDHIRLMPKERLNHIAYYINSKIHDKLLVSAINDYLNNQNCCKNLVVWQNGPLFSQFHHAFNELATAYDAVDNWVAHNSLKSMKNIIKQNYSFIQDHADIVFAVSKPLCDMFNEKRNISLLVQNGVDIKRFSATNTSKPRDIQHLSGPIIGYIGVMQDRVNTAIIAELAREIEHASVVLVGPVLQPDHFDDLRKIDNIIFTGAKHPNEISNYIKSFDVCIMPHFDNELTRSMDPIKLYEYLAAGKPTVATDLPSINHLDNLIYLAKDTNDFVRLVNKAIHDDDKQLIEKRIKFAENCSWDDKINDMLDSILNVIHKKS
jgi:glycosyltransferase involved in cell wall biosynthesis